MKQKNKYIKIQWILKLQNTILKSSFKSTNVGKTFSSMYTWLGLLDLILLLILFFYAKSIILRIISGLEIIQNDGVVKTSQALLTERIFLWSTVVHNHTTGTQKPPKTHSMSFEPSKGYAT